MNVAFVENAENDVDGNQGSQDQDGLIGQRLEEGRRGALERGLDAGWHVQFQLRAVDGVDRVAERGIGGQIERESDDRKLALMIECEGGGAGLETRKRAERDLCAIGRLYVNVFQRIGILLELRIDFHDHVILVELGKNCGDLALAKGIVERIVNVGRKNAEARGGVAIDRERSEQALVQLVAGDVAEFGERFQFVDEARSPVSELLGINVFEAVLELRAANAVFNGQVLDRLEEERDTVDFGKFGLKAADNIGGVDIALGERLEIDLDAATIQRGIRAVDADERGKAFDRRVLENDAGESLLATGHISKGNVLRAFGDAENDAGILDGEKSLGNVDIEKNCADESGDGNNESGCAVAEHELQGAAVECDDGIEGILGLTVEPALFFFFVKAEELGAHHGSQRQ